MEECHKKVLEKNSVFLGQNLNPDDVIFFLISKDVFRYSDAELIDSIPTREKKVSTFISILMTRGDNAFPLLLEALEKHEHSKYIAKKTERR